MNFLFIPQLFGFIISLIILSSGVNSLLIRQFRFSNKFLPWFAWGWCVYFLIYLIGRQLSASVETIRFLYTGMALGIPVIAGIWKMTEMRKFFQPSDFTRKRLYYQKTLVLTAIIGGSMIYVGPYLEFPSDPLYHVEAIQAWETVREMGGARDRMTHFAYFIHHWLLQPSNINLGDRGGLAVLCAALQGMLFWNFIRFTRFFSDNPWVGWFGGLASLGLFGINIFSFYRYYVLADTFIAYLVLLEALGLVCCYFFKERVRYLVLTIPLIAFCWQNHRQEVLLLLNAGIGVGVMLVIFRYRHLSIGFRKQWTFLIGLGIAGVALLLIFFKIPPYALEEPYLQKVMGGFFEYPLYVIRFSRINDVLGVGGWIAMVGALGILFGSQSKKLAVLAAVCLWPLLLLWNPFAIDLMNKAMPSSVLYRLMYGSLYWVFLMVFIGHLYSHRHFLLQWIPWNYFSSQNAQIYFRKLGLISSLSLVLLGTSLISQLPVRGKIPHLLANVEAQLNGKDLEPMIRYLRQASPNHCIDPYLGEAHLPVRSYVLSDSYINHYLLMTGYFYTISDRWAIRYPYGPEYRDLPNVKELGMLMRVSKETDLPDFPSVLKKHHICYVALYVKDSVPNSTIGHLSGHWPPDYVNVQHVHSKKLHQWIKEYSQHFRLVFEDNQVQVYQVL